MRKIAYSFILSLLVNFSYSQSTPLTDPAIWTLDFQDDFNYADETAFTAGNKWITTDSRAGECPTGTAGGYNALHYHPSGGSGNYIFSPGSQSYLTDAGMLSLVVKSISPTPLNGTGTYGMDQHGNYCTSNFIYSMPNAIKTENKELPWKYGFFEIRCRLPVTSSTKSNMGIGANFWLSPGGAKITSCYSEIDIFEFINGANSFWPTFANLSGYTESDQVRTYNSWYNAVNTPCIGNPGNPNPGVDAAINDGAFHTYAAAWYPDRIEYFRDGNLISVKTNNQSSMDSMFLIVDLNVFTDAEVIDTTNSDGRITQLPYSYDVDYVRVYKQTFDCSTAVVQSSYTYPGTDNGDVKKYYQIGGSGSSSLSSGAFYMRAGNSATNNGYIELKSGFEVQSGATFVAETVLCQ